MLEKHKSPVTFQNYVKRSCRLHGGVTVSHDTLFKVLGPEVVIEAEDALNGTSEMVSHLS